MYWCSMADVHTWRNDQIVCNQNWIKLLNFTFGRMPWKSAINNSFLWYAILISQYLILLFSNRLQSPFVAVIFLCKGTCCMCFLILVVQSRIMKYFPLFDCYMQKDKLFLYKLKLPDNHSSVRVFLCFYCFCLLFSYFCQHICLCYPEMHIKWLKFKYFLLPASVCCGK